MAEKVVRSANLRRGVLNEFTVCVLYILSYENSQSTFKSFDRYRNSNLYTDSCMRITTG